jgi:DNA repair protein RadC
MIERFRARVREEGLSNAEGRVMEEKLIGHRVKYDDALYPVVVGDRVRLRLARSEEMAHLEQEHFRVIVLNQKNEVISSPSVFVGSVNSTTIRTASWKS